MEEISIEEIIPGLITRYYQLFPEMPNVQVNIIITDCLSESHFELRPDLKDRLVEEGIEKDNEFNGRMVPPNKIGDTFSILLNKNKIIEYTEDGSMTWIGTLAHELTHAIDFQLMALREKVDSYDVLLEISEYLMFQLWSEFHARKIGYNFLSKFNMDIYFNDEKDRINHILTVEFPFHLKNHYTEYHGTNDGNKQMYCTMQLLGHVSVWADSFPDIFNETFLKNIFSNNSWMYNLFRFLHQYNSLDDIYSRFNEMLHILKENWKEL